MLRRVLGLIVIVVCCGAGGAGRAADHEVIGLSGGHRWEYMGTPSGNAAVGNPMGRLQVPVKNGETILFRVSGGSHGVLFERAVAEQSGGVWEEMVGGGGSTALKDLPATPGFDRFDRKNAKTTDAKGAGSRLIEIKIKALKPGLDNGILFACNPHSAQGNPQQTSMLGVIVLAPESPERKK
jgi:hypothetical protein